jgi:hypothetical protein
MKIEMHRGQPASLRTNRGLLCCGSVDSQGDLTAINWDLDLLDGANFRTLFFAGDHSQPLEWFVKLEGEVTQSRGLPDSCGRPLYRTRVRVFCPECVCCREQHTLE